MRTVSFLIILLAAVHLCGCSTRLPPPPLDDPGRALVAEVDSLGLEAFRALPLAEKTERRRLSDSDLDPLDLWERELADNDRLERGSIPLRSRDWRSLERGRPPEKRLDRIMRHLRRAVNTDPAHVRAWRELGRLAAVTGGWEHAAEAFDAGWAALRHDRRDWRAAHLGQRVLLGAAPAHRGPGLWGGGLGWLESPKGAWHHTLSEEQTLLYGLLLADAGRFREAFAVAEAMPPLRYHQFGMYRRGYHVTQSGYANRWIKGMAWLALGEPAFAYHALGLLSQTRIRIPYMSPYWNDVARICELTGRVDEASTNYALALLGLHPLHFYVPFEGYSCPEIILGEPDVRVPYFTVWYEDYLVGSLFAYGCQMLAECSVADDPEVRRSRGEKAVTAFSVCMRRGDRPARAQALRGRARFYMGRDETALADMLEGRRLLAERGEIDPLTAYVIGTLHLTAERPAESLLFLEEATAVAPELAAAWRTYGVALARVNRHAEADTAMNRAVVLDPGAASGWYNRGLQHMNHQRPEAARSDLLVALKLAPDDPRIRQLVARLERDWELADDPGSQAAAQARADSIHAEIASGDWLTRDATGGPRSFAIADLDFEARADSLAAAYAADPADEIRRELAVAQLQAGRPESTLELLLPLWPRELFLTERMLVLRADRELGHAERARDLALSLADGSPDIFDLDFWTLVALTCLDAGEREAGLCALDYAVGLAPANHALRSFRKLVGGDGTR
ncbi:hypothetical protein H8E07_11000 [bacterium]|nr:hypothetical protein [bacterium]